MTVSITTNVIQDRHLGVTTILWLLRDMTRQRRLEQQLQDSYADIDALVATRTADLAQANAQLRQELRDCRQGRDQ